MNSCLNKPIVLRMNANWQPLGWGTPKQAITALCGGVYGGTPPAVAVAITLDENGELVESIPLTWDEWIKLPVRECDLSLQMKDKAIRCPMVLVSQNYSHLPVKAIRLTRNAILERDGFRCMYTGEKLPRSQLNVDHVLPRDKGGKDSWDNLVACNKKLNSKKGNRTNKEMGLKLIKTPSAPKPVPVSFHVNKPRRPEHAPFILS